MYTVRLYIPNCDRYFISWSGVMEKKNIIQAKPINKHKLLKTQFYNAIPGTIIEKTNSAITIVCGDSYLIKIEDYELYANFSKLKTPLYQLFLIKQGDIIC